MARPTLRPLRRARRAALAALILTGLGAAAGCAEANTADVVHVRAEGTADAAAGMFDPQPAAAITFEVALPHTATIDPGPLLPLPVLPPAPPPAPAPPPSEPGAPTTP